jgi:C4-dicarboxylate transporter, DctQ subunit
MKILDHLEEWLIATLIAVATLIIFVAVVHRYGSTVPMLFPYLRKIDMSWAQELCIYMFVWMAKFGAAYGVRQGIHVGVDVFVNMIEPKKRKPVILMSLLAGALFTGIIGTLGADFVYHISQTGQVSNDLEVPMWIVYLAVPVGSFLMCFRFLQVAFNYLRTGELPHHDHSAVAGLDEVAPLEVVPSSRKQPVATTPVGSAS